MRKDKSEVFVHIVSVVVIVLLCFLCIYPFLNQLAISFNTGTDTAFGGVTIYPRDFTLENYKTVFRDNRVAMAAVITVSRTIITVIFSLIVLFAAAYALTRQSLYGRKAITTFLCIPMYLHAGLIPSYISLRYYGLINNYWIYIIPFIFSFYNMIVVRSFLQDIPISLEESAMLDGANEFRILFSIIIPISKPVLATVALWVAVSQWNDWNTTLMYVTSEKLQTLQYLTMKIIKQGNAIDIMTPGNDFGNVSEVGVTEETIKAAVLIVTCAPIIMVYPFLQKYFMKGMTLGAVKG